MPDECEAPSLVPGCEIRRRTVRERLEQRRNDLENRLRTTKAALAVLDSNDSIENIYNIIDAAL